MTQTFLGKKLWIAVLLLSMMGGGRFFAQTISGSIAGDVIDQQNLRVPNAQVVATEQEKQIKTTTTTDNNGHFVFADLLPGTYSIAVAAPGFRSFERRDVPLHAQDKVSVGELALEIGSAAATVEVTTQPVLLQTESGERSDVLEAKQMESIQVNGRSPLDLVKLTPGIVSTANFQVGGNGIGSNSGPTGIFVNGNRSNQNQITINGITDLDTGANNSFNVTVSLDATAEFKILTSAYQAEYGRSAGGQIAIVTKSGTDQYHGSGYWYHRHESMNANSWLNNLNQLPRNLYRYNDPGYTIGGPVWTPHLFPRGQNKLFFFFGEEFQRQLSPVTAKHVTMPTAAERSGDFSQSVDQNGNHVTIKDPATGKAFTGNIIPSSRIYGPGQALLNIFPQPNVSGQKGYNYTSQISNPLPRREDVLRVDYSPTANLRFFGHYINNTQHNDTPYGGSIFGLNFPLVKVIHPTLSNSYAAGITWIINPTTTNQFLFGTSHNTINYSLSDNTLTRTHSGINLPLLYPKAIQGDLIPSSSFSGQHMSNSPSFGTSNGPYVNFNTVIDISDNLSKLWGSHFLKTGVYLERSRKDQITGAAFNGNYNFGDNSSNPYDTGYGYANALLGVYQTFTQASSFSNGKYRYWNVEGYLQDTWKVSRRLTLDYGIRLAWYQPQYDSALQISSFDPAAFKSANVPRLYTPCFSGTKRSACDVQTGQTLAIFALAQEVPGTGDPYNGMVQSTDSNPYLMDNRGPQWGPRVGFAYSATGSTVVRGAAGIYYDRIEGNPTFNLLANPPNTVQPTLTYGYAQDIASGTALLAPPTVYATDKSGHIPTTYNYTLSVQQNLPGNLILDMAYVGTQGRHQQVYRNLNYVPYGATFLAQNQDPTLQATQPTALLGSNALPAAFLRPYVGYGTINLSENSSYSNYNALQTSVQRRTGKYLFLGVAYTWSKALSIASTDTTYIRNDQYNRQVNYGPTAFDLRHVFAANYVLTSPHFAPSSSILRGLVNGWQLSGVARTFTGAPFTPGYSISSATSANITGSTTEGARLRILCNPSSNVPGGPFGRLNASCLGAPLPGSRGLESGINWLRNPGSINFDMALQKQLSFTERVHLQLRVDAFNVLNHANFTGLYSTVNFSGSYPNGLTISNQGSAGNITGFGAVSSVSDPRILQTLVRIRF